MTPYLLNAAKGLMPKNCLDPEKPNIKEWNIFLNWNTLVVERRDR